MSIIMPSRFISATRVLPKALPTEHNGSAQVLVAAMFDLREASVSLLYRPALHAGTVGKTAWQVGRWGGTRVRAKTHALLQVCVNVT